MRINNVAGNRINSRLNFTSINNPVKPFKVSTKHGWLSVEEIGASEYTRPEFIKRITKFFIDNFSKDTKDPFWLTYHNGSPEEKQKTFDILEGYYAQIFNDKKNQPNLTLLVAEDENDEIQGACLTYGSHEIPESFESTLYVDSMATNKKYRGQKLAYNMLDKSLKANKNTFTDVYLTSTKFADDFYEKSGFVKLNPDIEVEKTILDHVAKIRQEYPEHITPYHKPLQSDKPRWTKKSAEAIKSKLI